MPNFSGVWNLKEQIQAIAAGRWTGLPTFELYAWGLNSSGQIGDETVVSKSSPVQVAGSDWAQISNGSRWSSALKTDGTLWTWGSNGYGQLGQGDVIPLSSPVQVGALSNWAQVSAGYGHGAALKTDGTLWTWGNGGNGRLGDGTSYINRSSPVQIGALTNWAQVSAGGAHTSAIKGDGTLWAWGRNDDGGIGDNTILSRSSPVQIGALTNWEQVSASGDHTAAVTTGGALYAWGRNTDGRLGQNNTINRSSPVQVGALTNWSQVSAGRTFTASVKTDGTIWTWGLNDVGQLGQNNITSFSSPVQIGTLTNWSQVSANAENGRHAAAIKTDGSLWTWGRNDTGALGDGTVVFRSSPVQIGATTVWTQVAAGAFHTTAILQGTTN